MKSKKKPWFSKFIADSREKLGLSQRGLCDATGIKFNTLIKYEGGTITPPIDVIYKVSELAGTNAFDYLTDEKDIEEFVEEPFDRLTQLVDKKKFTIGTYGGPPGHGYTQNDVIIVDNTQMPPNAISAKKTDLVMKIAAINEQLKADYESKLKAAVNDLIQKTLDE